MPAAYSKIYMKAFILCTQIPYAYILFLLSNMGEGGRLVGRLGEWVRWLGTKGCVFFNINIELHITWIKCTGRWYIIAVDGIVGCSWFRNGFFHHGFAFKIESIGASGRCRRYCAGSWQGGEVVARLWFICYAAANQGCFSSAWTWIRGTLFQCLPLSILACFWWVRPSATSWISRIQACCSSWVLADIR